MSSFGPLILFFRFAYDADDDDDDDDDVDDHGP